jgi:hypothetical protein
MQQMQKFFPILFGFIYLRVPSGAIIYMVVSSAMRIGTQEIMFRTGYVTPVVHEREIGPAGKSDKAGAGTGTGTKAGTKPAAKTPAKPAAKATPKTVKSTATDGTALAKGTLPPKKTASNGSNGKAATNGRAASNGKSNGNRAAANDQTEQAPAPKEHPRSRSKRERKAR